MKPKKMYLILLLPVGILLSYLAELSPQWVESVYSQGIFVLSNQVLSNVTGFFSFSLAEMFVILLLIASIISIIKLVIILVKEKEQRKDIAVRFLANTLILISVVYFAFNVLWGFNYYRLPFSEIAGMEVKPVSVDELEGLCISLIEQANDLRETMAETTGGVMRLRHGRENVFDTVDVGFELASVMYPQLSGRYGRPKGVILSELMSYAGITGIYFPFTGEANVNTTIPDYLLPFVTTHEMAHQRGFAREDEANYIAYLTSTLHPNPDFQYSGTLMALTYSTNALYRHDPARALLLREEYSEGLKRDLADRSRFWQHYEGPIERISRDINDSYLKANRQDDGIYSYGRMVDLLLAEYRLQASD
jgi:hypothetical protein